MLVPRRDGSSAYASCRLSCSFFHQRRTVRGRSRIEPALGGALGCSPRRARAPLARSAARACRPCAAGCRARRRRENSSMPTLSPFSTADSASNADSSTAASSLLRRPEPKSCDALTSTSSITVSSRSSTKRLMCGSPVRAVTFQSIARMSSPGTYGRTSSNSMPRPLNTERYAPAITSDTCRPRDELDALDGLRDFRGQHGDGLRDERRSRGSARSRDRSSCPALRPRS